MSKFFKTKLATHQTVINACKVSIIGTNPINNSIDVYFVNAPKETLNYRSRSDMMVEFKELDQVT